MCAVWEKATIEIASIFLFKKKKKTYKSSVLHAFKQQVLEINQKPQWWTTCYPYNFLNGTYPPKGETENLDTFEPDTCGIEYANVSFRRGGLETLSWWSSLNIVELGLLK